MPRTLLTEIPIYFQIDFARPLICILAYKQMQTYKLGLKKPDCQCRGLQIFIW